jgi:hypothetical protein
MMALLPWYVRWLALAAAIAAAGSYGWVSGARHTQDRWDADVAAQEVIQSKIAVRQAEATVQIVEKYNTNTKVIKEKGDEIIRAVPNYIPLDSCPAPAGERVLLDAAATGGPIPDAAAVAHAAPASARDVTATVTANYEACLLNSEQLIDLQDWIRTQEAAAK